MYPSFNRNHLFSVSSLMASIPIALAMYLSWLNRYYYLDDALIYARYIENLINGGGLVYNRGEYFNGLTSPLFTYLSIILSYLFGSVIFAINILSGIFLVLSIWIYQKIFSVVSDDGYIFVGSMLLVSSPYIYSVFGMETLLFLFLIGLSIYLFLNERYGYLLITLALLMLTRNEGVFLGLALVIEHFRLRRSFPKLGYFIIPAILIFFHYLFNYSYYGAILPETGAAKIWQGQSGLWGVDRPIFITGGGYLVNWVFGGSIYVLITLLLLSFLGAIYIGKKSINIIVVIFLFSLLLFYSVLNIPNYHWYNAPFIVFLFYYSAVGLQKIITIIRIRININGYIVLLIVMLLSFYPLYNNFSRLHFGMPNPPYKSIGDWLKQNTSKESSVAMVEIGIVGYFSDRRIIDILGLVNPFNAKYIGERKFDMWLTHYEPDYILAHDPLWPHESSVKNVVLQGKYLEYTKFSFSGYKLFAKEGMNIPERDLHDPFASQRLYQEILDQNPGSSPYVEMRRYGKDDVLFSHVGTEISVDSKTILPNDVDVLSFGIGFLDEAYIGENQSDGGCFEIYMNIDDPKNRIFSKCIDPKNYLQDRGVIHSTIQIPKHVKKYVFKVNPREGKSDKWGWSFWAFSKS